MSIAVGESVAAGLNIMFKIGISVGTSYSKANSIDWELLPWTRFPIIAFKGLIVMTPSTPSDMGTWLSLRYKYIWLLCSKIEVNSSGIEYVQDKSSSFILPAKISCDFLSAKVSWLFNCESNKRFTVLDFKVNKILCLLIWHLSLKENLTISNGVSV